MMSKKDKPYGSSLKNRVDALFNSSLTQKATEISISQQSSSAESEIDWFSSSQKMISIDKIALPSYQPRQYFDPDSLTKLAATIKAHGIVEPLIVRLKIDSTTQSWASQKEESDLEQYELVAGGRRYRAALSLGLEFVPVVILNLSETEALELAILENLARENLNPIEETEALLNLLSNRLNLDHNAVVSLLHQMRNQVKGISNRNVSVNHLMEVETVQQLFEPMGLSWKSFVETRLPLLKLPQDLLEPLRQGKIEYTKAKALARMKDEDARKQLLEDAIANSLSLSQIRSLIKEAQPPKQQSELRTRFDATYKRAKQAKSLWSNAKKKKQLESLLARLEKLIESEK